MKLKNELKNLKEEMINNVTRLTKEDWEMLNKLNILKGQGLFCYPTKNYLENVDRKEIREEFSNFCLFKVENNKYTFIAYYLSDEAKNPIWLKTTSVIANYTIDENGNINDFQALNICVDENGELEFCF